MRIKFTLFALLAVWTGFSQAPDKPTASEIFESIKKLQFLGSVLYIAAHPDDENTRLITHLANHYKADVTYLSITRGDGGQNLIGPELGDLLGVIRTYELLEARKIDGGNQLFTRAVDFGYSKHPDETFHIWNKDIVLEDIVFAIRRTQPDIIINRFDYRSPGATHGHHTGSAILSMEAFDLAKDKNAYKHQLTVSEAWQPKRLFFNTSWWFYGSMEKFEKADKSNLFAVNVGVYYPSLGLSDSEISALSRSQHQSQGFGNTGSRGQDTEYLELLKGDMPTDNLFEGIDTSWNRVKGGSEIGIVLSQVENEFDFKNPSLSVPKLLEAYRLIKSLEDSHWKKIKLAEITEIIAHCSGLFLEAVSDTQNTTPQQEINLQIEAINRSKLAMELEEISFQNQKINPEILTLNNNSKITIKQKVKINNFNFTSPFWLQKKSHPGYHNIEDFETIGLPEIVNDFPVDFVVTILGEKITFRRNLVYKFNSPVTGEVYQPFQILPDVTGKFDEEVILFPDNQAREVKVTLQAGRDKVAGILYIESAEGWEISNPLPFSLDKKGEEKSFVFTVTPPNNTSESTLQLRMQVDTQIFHHKAITLDYPHIPYRKVLLDAEAKVSRIDLQKKGQHIGYITGAGDEIPRSLRQIGYQVTEILPENITSHTLENFDAIVLGIRAYNTVAALEFKQEILFDYVKNGGNVIVQYCTSRELLFHNIAPYPLTLSRDRVTDENAKVNLINPKHKVLNFPNKITDADFENWVQERGLYFASDWDKNFEAILKMNDPGEKSSSGALLIAQYGKGYFTYTGLSFFRQLPNGVSGAYRLFANLISLNQD